ncbi:MAG: large conductance mechanosensitive channel protein MscL [Patescibacteria group bacterium]
MIHKTRGLWKEFKNFAVKGNAFELAIAVVIGASFTAIVNSLVADIVTPLLGIVTGNVDFKTLLWEVRPGLIVKYGSFLQAIFNFLVVSVAIFVVFKLVLGARKRLFKEGEQAVPPEEKPAQERLLEEIRDLLKQK